MSPLILLTLLNLGREKRRDTDWQRRDEAKDILNIPPYFFFFLFIFFFKALPAIVTSVAGDVVTAAQFHGSPGQAPHLATPPASCDRYRPARRCFYSQKI